MEQIKDELNYEEALEMLMSFLKKPDYRSFTKYGYDVYLPSLVTVYLNMHNCNSFDAQRVWIKWSPVFYEAAWELCRRGILRPGIKKAGEQATDDGNAGNGYSITPFGRTWLENPDKDAFVPTEPERFGRLIEKHKKRFGMGYQERGQQAVRCYGAQTYLACCVMCGAAAESILLAAATAKEKKRGTSSKAIFSKWRTIQD